MQRPPRYALKSGFGWGLGLSLALSGLSARPALAQYKLPAPVLPPATGTLPAPIQAAPPQAPLPVLVPVNPPQSNAGVAPVAPDAASKTAALTVPLLVAQWRAQKSTPQEAWDKGTLTVEDLIYILNHSIDYWGGFYWEKNLELRRELVALLIQHGSDKIAKPETLSPFVRLWLADYYESIGDAQTIPLCESIIAKYKTPVAGENPLLFQAIERLAWYYKDRHEFVKSAQTWLRLLPLYTSTGWYTADATWLAGRMYLYANDLDKAQVYFDKAKAHKYPFYDSMIQYDQACYLLSQAKPQEAQRSLEAALKTQVEPVNRAILLMVLSQAYYAMSDFDKAKEAAQSSLTEQGKAINPSSEIGMDTVKNTAQDILKWSQLWLQKPLRCDREKIELQQVKAVPGKPPVAPRFLTAQLTVRAYKTMPLEVSCADPQVHWRLASEQEDAWGLQTDWGDHRYVEWTVEIEVPSGTAIKTVLRLHSPELPTAICNIPLEAQ